MRRVLRTRWSILFAVPLIALLGGLGYALPAAAARIPLMHTPTTYCVKWKGVNSPNVASDDNYLEGVAALSGQDIWAVGFVVPSSRAEQALIEHYNGTNWTVISNPTSAPFINELFGVAAISSTDVWAVGYYANSGQRDQPLIEHWNGSNWSIVSSPTFSLGGSLLSVAALSANDVWAVGSYTDATSNQESTLVEHWNGSTWNVVVSPNASHSFGSWLTSIAVISDSDIWAMGSFTNSTEQTLLMHWNGSAWSIVPSPNAISSSTPNSLASIAALSSTNVWAVGSYLSDPNNEYDQTLIEHWDGAAWSIVPSLNEGISSSLSGVTAVAGSNQVWAVGSYYDASAQASGTLTEHWDGTRWSIVSSPNVVGATGNALVSVTSLSVNDQWAVGSFGIPSTPSATLTEHRTLASSPTGACPNY